MLVFIAVRDCSSIFTLSSCLSRDSRSVLWQLVLVMLVGTHFALGTSVVTVSSQLIDTPLLFSLS